MSRNMIKPWSTGLTFALVALVALVASVVSFGGSAKADQPLVTSIKITSASNDAFTIGPGQTHTFTAVATRGSNAPSPAGVELDWVDDCGGGYSPNPSFTDVNGESNVILTACAVDGKHRIIVTDPVTGKSGEAHYTVDATAPVASPTQSPAANGAGWTNSSPVTVSWNWTDSGAGASGIDPANCTITSTASAQGSTTLTATCKDLAGNTGTASYTVKIDSIAPVITGSRTPAANGVGWNNTNVTVSFTCTDTGGSGVASSSGPTTLSTDGAGQSVTGTCTDNAGNSASATVSGINIDKTAPAISGSASPAANGNGWNNTNVTVSFTCTDGGSGVASSSAPTTLSTEAAGQSVTGTCTDNAGNSASATVSGINIDKTAPATTATATPSTWTNGSVTVHFAAAADSGSPITCDADVVVSSEGVSTVNGSCTDAAGNSASASATAKIDKTAPVITGSASPAANGAGWNNTNVTVSFTCTDDASGVASSSGPTTLSSDGSGQSVTGTCTDNAGNSASVTVSGINIDKTKPATTATATPSTWTNGSVTIHFAAAADGGSPITCDSDVVVSAEGVSTVTGSCTDAAGNTKSASATAKIDLTAPATTATATPSTWTNGSVTIHFAAAADSGSPITCDSDVVVTAEGVTTVTGACTDAAGNAASASATAKIDKTAPVITGSRTPAANGNGWNNGNVTVSFTCTDEASGVASSSGPTTLSSDGASESVTGTCTDNAGNSASATVSDINIDKTAPAITGSRTPAANGAGWNNSDVTVSFACTDGGSGVDSSSAPTTLGEGAGQSVTGTCTDKAGNSASATVSGINIDKTNPTITAANSGTLGNNGWYVGNVTVTFTCTDGLSGVASSSSPATLSDGSGQTATGTCTDKAGNSASVTSAAVNIDTTKPSISGSRTPAANGNGWNNTDVTVSFTCTDGGSGVASSSAPTTLSAEAAGQSVTGTCTDSAGNSASATVSGINIDKTAPATTATATPSTWTNGSVTVHFAAAADSGSPITCDSDVVVTTEGVTTTVTGACTDAAGNSASASATASIDKTKPVITASAKTADGNPYTPTTWTNQSVTVTFVCTDEASGVASFTAPVTVSAEGAEQAVIGTCTDNAGNTATISYGDGIDIDKTKPVAAPTQSPAANGAGWNNTDVVVTWHWTDAGGSGIDTANCTTTSTSTGEGTITLNASCKDNAGNTGTASYTVKVDKTAPAITAANSGTLGNNGWYVSNVTVTFTCTDALSGVASSSGPATLSTEGTNLTATGTCTDVAGNSASVTSTPVKIDKTAPAITLGSVANGSPLGTLPTCTATDAVSGLASKVLSTTYVATPGGIVATVKCAATDNAGNSTFKTTQYTSPASVCVVWKQPVRTPIMVFNTGSNIPLKLACQDINGNALTISGLTATVSVVGISGDATGTTPLTGAAMNASSGQYMTNWNSVKSTKVGTYRATATFSDGSTSSVDFGMVK